jgi:flavin-dependent dehydrogenase
MQMAGPAARALAAAGPPDLDDETARVSDARAHPGEDASARPDEGVAAALSTDEDAVLVDGSRVAVLGGGPAGSLFTYFLLDMAERVDLRLEVDIYEPRLFDHSGAVGCNMCGGLISESLVQNLAADGVFLSGDVIQRGINAYVLHTDVGSVRISTPNGEMRMGAVHRGAGPKDLKEAKWESFDQHLLTSAVERGAKVIQARVEEVARVDGRPTLRVRNGEASAYDLVVVATGVNSSILKTFEGLGIGYERPKLTKTLIREYCLGQAAIDASLGSAMHVFLLNIPRLEFAALIPKGDYVTMCLLGEDIDNALGDTFAAAPEVRAVMPEGWDPEVRSCQCLPHINVHGVAKPYADRMVFIGDSGVTRLYKDGIGAAYRTAKAAARAAVFEGVSERAFREHYEPVCQAIRGDNRIGAWAFVLTRLAQRLRVLRRAILAIATDEQVHGRRPRLSSVLWDIFSGSAPYSDIFRRMFDPGLMVRGVAALPGVLLATIRGTGRTPVRETATGQIRGVDQAPHADDARQVDRADRLPAVNLGGSGAFGTAASLGAREPLSVLPAEFVPSNAIPTELNASTKEIQT